MAARAVHSSFSAPAFHHPSLSPSWAVIPIFKFPPLLLQRSFAIDPQPLPTQPSFENTTRQTIDLNPATTLPSSDVDLNLPRPPQTPQLFLVKMLPLRTAFRARPATAFLTTARVTPPAARRFYHEKDMSLPSSPSSSPLKANAPCTDRPLQPTPKSGLPRQVRPCRRHRPCRRPCLR